MLQTGIFRSKWWMVAAALVALTLNTGVVQSFALAVFIVPVNQDLGISRAEFLGAPLVGSVVFLIVTMPLFGKALDRYGLRLVHMLMIAGFGVSTMCLAFLRPPFYAMVLLFSLQHLFSTRASRRSPTPKRLPRGSTRTAASRSASPSPVSAWGSPSFRPSTIT